MKKQKLFKGIDLIVYFNIFMFTSMGVTNSSNNIYVNLVIYSLGFLNLVFLVLTIRLRKQYNDNIVNSIDIELKAESKLDRDAKEFLNNAKKQQLEARIEAEIIDKIPDAKVIRNAFIPKQDGSFTEVDLILISNEGIFVIEAKNITGRIVGNWKEENLKVIHPGGNDYPLFNPIFQNNIHYQQLKNILGMKNDYFRSVVVFGDKSLIESYRDVPFYAQICRLDNLIRSIHAIAKRFNTSLETHMVNNIYENLLPFISKTEDKEMKHIDRIKDKF